MPMNRIQFQHGMSLAAFQRCYGTEAQCEAALFEARWPRGFVCPQCASPWHSNFERAGQRLWQCARCRAQSSLTAGTVFAATKLPLTVWFLAMYLLTQAKNSISALELKRQLGVCYVSVRSTPSCPVELSASRIGVHFGVGGHHGLGVFESVGRAVAHDAQRAALL